MIADPFRSHELPVLEWLPARVEMWRCFGFRGRKTERLGDGALAVVWLASLPGPGLVWMPTPGLLPDNDGRVLLKLIEDPDWGARYGGSAAFVGFDGHLAKGRWVWTDPAGLGQVRHAVDAWTGYIAFEERVRPLLELGNHETVWAKPLKVTFLD